MAAAYVAVLVPGIRGGTRPAADNVVRLTRFPDPDRVHENCEVLSVLQVLPHTLPFDFLSHVCWLTFVIAGREFSGTLRRGEAEGSGVVHTSLHFIPSLGALRLSAFRVQSGSWAGKGGCTMRLNRGSLLNPRNSSSGVRSARRQRRERHSSR